MKDFGANVEIKKSSVRVSKGELHGITIDIDPIPDLAQIFIVSGVKISADPAPADAVKGENAGVSVAVAKAEGEKCRRCWAYTGDVGCDENHPTLCKRYAAIFE